jgi:predicted CoA-binding protein
MKTTQASIKRFFSSAAYAVIGASADRKKFGNTVLRTMIEKEFSVHPVNPRETVIEGKPCYASIADIPEDVKSVVMVVPPMVTEQTIAQCRKKGISGIWMQPGSESSRAIADAEAAGMTVISPECILMFLEPVESVHSLHRWFKKILGQYPK